MEEQKLDSILEEHFKLRGYMRTVQIKAEIAAYFEVSDFQRNIHYKFG